MLIICDEKVLLFHMLTFIPEKLLWLPALQAFIVFMRKKIAKRFCSCNIIHKKRETFSTQIISNIPYYEKYTSLIDTPLLFIN